LLNEALDKISFPREGDTRLTILELGCGFGSATFPLLQLLPNSYLIASEFSTSMLFALKTKLDQRDMTGSCVLLQLNAEDLDFKAASFDLIVGSALLHHLFQPEKVLEQSARILKRGGATIFFEPFEIGHSILSLIYKRILRDKRRIFLSQGTKKYLKNCISTWAKMRIKDKTDPFFVGIDDKWVFTKQYFFDLVEKYDYEKTIIFPLEKSNKPFLSLAKSHFKGNNIKNIPKWVWEIIDEYEEHFSEDVKTDLLTEGCIILKK
jgi:ubiquinone/menaquinone biosynthesis C-methylase UbiE